MRREDEDLFAGQTDARAARMRQVVEGRTRHLCFLLDDVHGVHNLAAVVRSCDAWGIADLHCIMSDEADVVKNRKQQKSDGDLRKDRRRFHRTGETLAELFEKESTKRVSKGTDKWLSIHEYADARSAIEVLKSRGYRICVSSLKPDAHALSDVDLRSSKVCFVFGNEHSGVSREVEDMADEFFTIPMYGFVESCNISVAAATTASHIVERARSYRNGDFLESQFFLSAAEQRETYHRFLTPKPSSRRQNSHERLRSRFDVTRLGSFIERRIAREGLFVQQPSDDSSVVKLLEEGLRLGADTGTLLSRFFVRRAKIGALGDSGRHGFSKRCNSIVDGVAGANGLACESAVAGTLQVMSDPQGHRLW